MLSNHSAASAWPTPNGATERLGLHSMEQLRRVHERNMMNVIRLGQRSNDMGLNGNGRAEYGSVAMPPMLTHQTREPAEQRELAPRPHRDNLSEILARASKSPDGTEQLKEIVAGITREPRAAIDEIEQEIASLRGQIAVREQTLVEAIGQHANLSKEAVRGMGVVRQALVQIRDAFDAAMPPTPTARSASQASNGQRS